MHPWVVEVLLLLLLVLVLVLLLLVLLLAEDLELQKELLLLEESSICRVHGWRGLLCLLVRRDVLVILQLLHLGLGVLGLFVTVLAVTG